MTLLWNIVIHKLVLSEDFKKIDPPSRRLILKSIYKKLTKDPESYGSPPSEGYKGYWKLRVAHYRVIYRIIKDQVMVVVIGYRFWCECAKGGPVCRVALRAG